MIKILNIKLKNFMCIESAHLDFPENKSTMIIGENGSGKSAILCAIGLAFTAYKKGGTYADFIKKDCDESTIILNALINDEPILFDITLSRKGTALGRVITYNHNEYKNSECDEILATLNVAYFSNVIFSMQDEGDITKMKPSARADLLSKLLDFDFSAEVKALTDYISEVKAKVTENTSQINFNTTLIEDKKKEIVEIKPLSFTSEDINNTQKELDSVKSKIDEYDSKTDSNTKINEEIEKARKPLEDLEVDFYNYDSSIQSINQNLANFEKDTLSYEKNKKAIEQNIDDTNNSIISNKEKEKELLKKLETADDEVKAAKAALTSKSKEIVGLTVKITQTQSTIDSKKADIAFISQGTCPTCKSPIDGSAVPELTAFVEKLSKDKADLIELQRLEYEAESSLETICNDKQAAYTNVHGELTSNASVINTLNANLVSYKDQLSKLEKPSQDKITSNKSLLEISIAARQKLKTKIDEIKETIKSLESKRFVLDRNEKIQLKTEENRLSAKIKEYNDALKNQLETEQNNKRLEKEIESCTVRIEELKETNVKLNQEIDDNTEAKKILDKDLPNYLIVKTCDKLEKRINKFIHSVFPNMTIKMYQDKKGVDFFYVPGEYSIDPNNKESWINISMSSGCEKAALSVGWRVALAESYGIDILMLDECDAAATDSSSEKLLTSVLDSSKFSQVFIITHRKETRDSLVACKDIKVYYASHGCFSETEPEDELVESDDDTNDWNN